MKYNKSVNDSLSRKFIQLCSDTPQKNEPVKEPTLGNVSAARSFSYQISRKHILLFTHSK